MRRVTSGQCFYCGSEILWCAAEDGCRVSIGARPSPDGDLIIDSGMAVVATASTTVAVRYKRHELVCKGDRP